MWRYRFSLRCRDISCSKKSTATIYVTGNTAIDALKTTVREDYTHPELEGIAAGTLKLVGTDEEVIYNEFSLLLSDEAAYEAMSRATATAWCASASRIFWSKHDEKDVGYEDRYCNDLV